MNKITTADVCFMTDAEITARLLSDEAGLTRLLRDVLREDEEEGERWDGQG